MPHLFFTDTNRKISRCNLLDILLFRAATLTPLTPGSETWQILLVNWGRPRFNYLEVALAKVKLAADQMKSNHSFIY